MSVVLRRIAACKASPIPVSPRKLIGGEFLATVIEHQTLVINTLRHEAADGPPTKYFGEPDHAAAGRVAILTHSASSGTSYHSPLKRTQ